MQSMGLVCNLYRCTRLPRTCKISQQMGHSRCDVVVSHYLY